MTGPQGTPTSDPRRARDHETLPILAGELGQIAMIQYRLRATAHRIAADCERLFAEMDWPGRETWRAAAGKALLAARQLLSQVERRTGSTRAITPDTLTALRSIVTEPQQEIVDAMSSLLVLIPTDLEEELIMQDARGIRDLAIGLLSADGGRTQAAGGGSASAAGQGIAVLPERPARVLVVDDEETLRRSLSRLLQRLGYEAVVAENGRAALEQAEQEPPDLIITDLSMPGMGGHELLSRIKAGELTRHIPVIVVSGAGDTQSVVKCLEEGAEDYLVKPYEVVVLQARIRALLERKRMRDLELAHLRRVTQLTAAAEAVERHRYESRLLEDLVTQPDQLGQLARVFDRMIMGMRTREAQLQAQVSELRREIEQVATPAAPLHTVSEESPFAVGQSLAGRYVIKRELGRGGMGMVYQALDRELAEDVAVKIVRREIIGKDPHLLERLKSEIRLARKISHRNVVRTHDLGEFDGVYFLTMEYIKGVTVGDLIATRGRLGVDSTLAIGTQLAEALAVAHREEIIHRDIKPQNLLVDAAGVLKVTDFGLARTLERTSGLTQAGYLVGTPRYMAPEQLMGGDVDARTDLFATGIVLYECLTGQAPFEASSPMAVVARMMAGPPPPIVDLVPGVPSALASVIERLLQREPERRFGTARDLAEELAQVSQVAT